VSAAADALKDLPRLDDSAMGPCAVCDEQLLNTGFPLFYRLDAKRCAIDANEVRKHVGFAMALGGGQGGLVLASLMGPGVKPVVIMEEPKTFNVCIKCAQTKTLETIVLLAAAKEGEKE